MSFLRVLADFTACQPLGLIYAVEARDKERKRRTEETDGREERKKEGIGEEKKDCEKEKKKANMDREVLTRALTELS